LNAVILVAGNARRMGDLTARRHKCLLDAGGITIVDHILQALMKNGIKEVVFASGFRERELRQHLSGRYSEINFRWIPNPVYNRTNTSYSVWLMKELMLTDNVDMLLINGDVIMDHRSIAATIQAPGETVLAVRLDSVDDEEVKFRVDSSGKILEIGKHIPPSQAAGESIGINLLSRNFLPRLFEILERRIKKGNGANEFYETSFDEAIRSGEEFFVADVTPFPIMEIDTSEDYYNALKTVVPHLQSGGMA